MNTKSVKSSHVPGLSVKVAGSEGLSPSSPNLMRFGPMAPRFKYTEAAPGPPFRAKVTGRSLPSTVYEVQTTSPLFLPSLSYTGSVPRAAVYGSGLPRSEEHTAELQSPCNLVCRLLLEK